MEAGSSTPPGQSSRRLLWGVIIAVVVVAAVAVAAVLFLWPREERISVPDVVGLSTESAERVLEAAGLVLGDVKRVSVDAEATEVDTVLSQTPAADTEVDSGSEVALVVAEADEEAGAEGTETPPAAGGSASNGGSGTEPEPESSWHEMFSILSESGPGDHVCNPFDAVTQQHKLEVTVSSSSGGQFTFAIIQIEPASMQPWFSRDVSGQPATTRHTYLVDLVVGRKYHIAVFPPSDGHFSYTLYDYRP
jgi:beta-lactam-binding protein with PASTA domain